MFKTKVKRYIAVLPAIFIVIFSCTFSLTAYADGGSGGGTSFGEDTSDSDFPSDIDSAFATKDECNYYFYRNYDLPDSYIFLRYSTFNYSTGGTYPFQYSTRTVFFRLDRGVTYTESNGIYTFSDIPSNSNLVRLYVAYTGTYMMRAGSTSPTTYHQFIESYYNVESLSFNLNEGDVYVNGVKGTSFIVDNKDYHVFDAQLVLNGEQVKRDDIEVKSYPVLEGQSSFNQLQLDNNYRYDSSKHPDKYLSSYFFQIDVINHSDKNFQFALYFVEKGKTLQYIDNFSDILGSRFFYGNPKFIYISDEWYLNYNHDGKSKNNFIAPGFTGDNEYVDNAFDPRFRMLNGPSAWHMAEAGSTYTCTLGECLVKFKKDVEYDIVVIGSFVDTHTTNYIIDSNESMPLYVVSANQIDPYICLDSSLYDVEEFYRCTFWLDRDTAYDENEIIKFNSSMGNDSCYRFDPESENNEVFNTIYAQENYDGSFDNSPNIINSSYGGVHSEYKGYTLNGVANGGYNANFGNYSSLSSGFSSVFGLITTFLHKLPSEFLSIFTFGFTALVVVSIVKAVRGG